MELSFPETFNVEIVFRNGHVITLTKCSKDSKTTLQTAYTIYLMDENSDKSFTIEGNGGEVIVLDLEQVQCIKFNLVK